MTKRIKVAVSPFYGGTEWTDEFTGVTFKKNVNGLNVYSIPADSDMTGIAAAIRLNALILFEGEISQDYTEAAKTYQEPGRWTETVIQKTEPKPVDPPTKEEEKEEDTVVDTDPADTPGDTGGQGEDTDTTQPETEDTTEELPADGETDTSGDDGNVVDDGAAQTAGVQTFSSVDAPEYETVNPDDMTVDELSAHTEKYNIPVEGTGSTGNAIKADYIAAIKAYQE